MFYGNNRPMNNNNNTNLNVNTNYFVSFSDVGYLVVGGWNKLLSVKIKPCVGTDANGIRQYSDDPNMTVSTSITAENALAFLKGYEEFIVPVMEGKMAEGSVSIAMGSNDQRKVITMKIDSQGDAYLEIAVGLNENGQAKGLVKHKFNKKSFMTDYNPEIGHATEHVVQTDLLNFIEKVKSVATYMDGTVAHSIRYNNESRNDYANRRNAQQAQKMNNMNMQGNYVNSQPATPAMDFLPFD